MDKQNKLIWLDLEMTGLNPNDNVILEIATVITNAELEEIAVGPVLAIHQPESELAKQDNWNVQHHTESGLLERTRKSNVSVRTAERQTLDFLQRHLQPKTSPMCGNSICMDRRFLATYMPDLENFFHYRNLDVTSLKILFDMWKPAKVNTFKKKNEHLALADIRESIAELAYYRNCFLTTN